ncbi:hypothetical protein GGI15_002538 [Coemansia interrupta]|uniref:Uncharacterized protein n=1 Tax=Coemansia interrupta TaxID=1126814 RepID=A0A9W8LL33_9FUNG|nr:hypothetical protein GGI15_002538 [Coemansia interrupta]
MGANETVPTYHSFVDGCYLHQDAYGGAATLVSFHLLRYALFTLMLVVVGPFTFRIVAAFFDLERDFKSIADHFDDVTSGLIYSYILFTLGNYAHTFSWVTLVFYFVGLLCFCVLVELPFMRVSLNGWRSWSTGAWAVNLGGLALVLVAAGFHIRWAYLAGILQWYLPLFVLATASVWSTVFVKRLQHHCIDNRPEGLGIERRTRRAALILFTRRSAKARRQYQAEQANQLEQLRQRAEQYAANTAAATPSSLQPADNGNDDLAIGDLDIRRSDSQGLSEGNLGQNNTSRSLLNMPIEPNHRERIDSLTHEQKNELIEGKLKNLHYLNVQTNGPLPLHRLNLHLHHWQIFYILAFFTRFDEFASKMCAGVVLGIFTQGYAAYGFDPMVERKC